MTPTDEDFVVRGNYKDILRVRATDDSLIVTMGPQVLVASFNEAKQLRDWIDRTLNELDAAAGVGEKPPHFWSGAEEVRLATIERCAKVAETFDGYGYGNAKAWIAARIRALKDKGP